MKTAKQDFAQLMSLTENPDDIMAVAFAGVISRRYSRHAPYNVPIAGLDRESINALIQYYFHGYQKSGCLRHLPERQNDDEFSDLAELLMEHRTVKDEKSYWLAYAIATACMDSDHLWQDMGLPNRAVLSKLLSTYFTSLFQLNTKDMKWKKFFYRQLCERSGLFVCRSPSCEACGDYNACFGPETASPDNLLSSSIAVC